MTTEQYATAYIAGYDRTVGLLMRRGVRNRLDAEDMSQEAWLKGWMRREQIRNPKVIGAWINSIALNVWRGRLRSGVDLQPLWDLDEVRFRGGRAPEIDTLAMDRRKLMRMVPVRDREVMRDYYVSGYSTQEIADAQGKNWNSVKIRIMRASSRLRRQVCRA